MASRYLVFGGTTTNWSDTSNWSETDGGASGASFPVTGDDVYMTTLSLNANIKVNASRNCLTLNMQGTYAGQMDFAAQLNIGGGGAGVVTFTSGATFANSSGTPVLANAVGTACTWTFNGNTFPYKIAFSSATHTISDNLIITGGCTSSTSVFNGNTITVSGGVVTHGAALTGTTNWVVKDTTLTATGTVKPTNNYTLKPVTAGGLIMNAGFSFGTGTLIYDTSLGGTANTTGGTLTINASCSLNISGLTTFSTVTVTGTTNITLLSAFSYSTLGTLTLPNANFSFIGAFNVTGGTVTNSTITTSRTYTFVASQTYTFNNIVLNGTSNSVQLTLVSSIASTKANIILTSGTGTQKVLLVKATDIDSSGGEPIRSVGIRPQDLTHTTNWTNNSGQFLIFMK